MSKPGVADDGTNPFDLEFPAFPDLTIPFLGGILYGMQQQWTADDGRRVFWRLHNALLLGEKAVMLVRKVSELKFFFNFPVVQRPTLISRMNTLVSTEVYIMIMAIT